MLAFEGAFYMNCKDLVLKKSFMPYIKLVISEDASNSGAKDKLRQKISIRGGIEDEDKPSTIKVRIEISVDTESERISLEVCKEDTYKKPSDEKWNDSAEALQDIKNIAIPKSYEGFKAFVEDLSEKAGIHSIHMPDYEEIKKDEED